MKTPPPAPKKRAAAAPVTPVKSTQAAPAAKSKPVVKKTPAAVPPAPAAPAAAAKPKHKLVRDSFTIPKPEYVVLEALKLRAAKLGRPTKKSEVLRAGVAALDAMSDKAFLAAIVAIPSIKTGRPKNPPKAES